MRTYLSPHQAINKDVLRTARLSANILIVSKQSLNFKVLLSQVLEKVFLKLLRCIIHCYMSNLLLRNNFHEIAWRGN
jgi:hypothetical protein